MSIGVKLIATNTTTSEVLLLEIARRFGEPILIMQVMRFVHPIKKIGIDGVHECAGGRHARPQLNWKIKIPVLRHADRRVRQKDCA